MRRELEYQIQKGFVQLCAYNLVKHPELRLAFHPPNGGLRPATTSKDGKRRVSVAAAKLKAMGARKDVPDWVLPAPRGTYSGMWIEFKAPGRKPTPEQAAYHELLRAEGHYVVACTDILEAWALVCEYLSLPKRPGVE